MTDVRIAVQIRPEQSDYADIARALDEAEELGVDIAYTWDHFFPPFGDPGGKHFECWTLLAAFAERSQRVGIGALVTGNSYRNPQLLADMARTVDHISGGRAILGMGAGWFERDYVEYGYEYGTPGSRLRALAEAMPLIESRLEALNPPPIGRLPILIGGGGEKVTLRIVARHADIWHGMGSADVIKHKSDVLDEWCRKVGRDPADIERATSGPRVARDGVAAYADKRYDIGIRQFTINLDGPEFDTSGIADWLAWRDEKNASA